MSMPVLLRRDLDAARLRRLARDSKDANQARRLLALATIHGGGTRTKAAGLVLPFCNTAAMNLHLAEISQAVATGAHAADDIVDHCCEAWNKLVDQPWQIISMGMRAWAHRI